MAQWWETPAPSLNPPDPVPHPASNGLDDLAPMMPGAQDNPYLRSALSAYQQMRDQSRANLTPATLDPASAPPVESPKPEAEGLLAKIGGTVLTPIAETLTQIGPALYNVADAATGGYLDEGRRRLQAGAQNLLGDDVRWQDIPTMAEGAAHTKALLTPYESQGLKTGREQLSQAQGVGESLKTVATNPYLLGGMVAESLPWMIGIAGPAKAAATAAFEGALAKGATQAVAEAAAKTAATRASIAGNFAISGGTSGLSAQERIYGMSEAELAANSPRYQTLRKQGLDHRTAQEALARTANLQTTAVSGALGAGATALLGGGLEAQIAQRLAGVAGPSQGVVKNILGGAARESGEEYLQSGGERLGENVGLQAVNPTTPLLNHVFEDAAVGALVGAVAGGTFGALGDTDRTRQGRAGQDATHRADLARLALAHLDEPRLAAAAEQARKALADNPKMPARQRQALESAIGHLDTDLQGRANGEGLRQVLADPAQLQTLRGQATLAGMADDARVGQLSDEELLTAAEQAVQMAQTPALGQGLQQQFTEVAQAYAGHLKARQQLANLDAALQADPTIAPSLAARITQAATGQPKKGITPEYSRASLDDTELTRHLTAAERLLGQHGGRLNEDQRASLTEARAALQAEREQRAANPDWQARNAQIMQANDPREVRLRQAFAKNPEKTVARLTANDAPLIDTLIQSFESRAQNYAQTGYPIPESITRPLNLLQARKTALETDATQKQQAAEAKRQADYLRQQKSPVPTLADALDLTPTNADPLGDWLQQRADIADEQGQMLKRAIAALQSPPTNPEQQRRAEEGRRLIAARLEGELLQQGIEEQAARAQAQAAVDDWIGSGGQSGQSRVIGQLGQPLGDPRVQQGRQELSRLLGLAPAPQTAPVAPASQPQSLADFLTRDSTAGNVPPAPTRAEGPIATPATPAPRPKRTQDEIKAMQGKRPATPAPVQVIPETIPDDDPLFQGIPKSSNGQRETINIEIPERQQLRKAIVDSLFEGKTATAEQENRKPIAYVMGGGGASGKGTLLKDLRELGEIPENAVHIDSDAIKERLPEYEEMVRRKDGRGAAITHEESSMLGKDAMQRVVADKFDLIYDRTLGNPEKAFADIRKLKDAGYEVRLYGITVDPNVALERAEKRAQRTFRFVPAQDLVQAHRGFATGFEEIVQYVDSAELYDNSGKNPVLIAMKPQGGSLAIIRDTLYNQFRERGGNHAHTRSVASRRENHPGTAASNGNNPGTVGESPRGAGPGGDGSLRENHAGRGLEAARHESPAATPAEPALSGPVIREIPVAQLRLSKDVPQFKSDANPTTGVVEPLGGSYQRVGTAPIIVWERRNGDLEVISGRHRLDLARRSGEQTIPAQVLREADGFDADQAAILDAELNIRSGQGKVKDYVQYFQVSRITRQAAESRGLLARALGQRAYTLTTDGQDELLAAHRANALSDEAAVRIAQSAPGNARLQTVGIKAVLDGKSIVQAVNTMQAVKAMAAERGATSEASGDMFGFDDSAMREAEQMATLASRQQRQLSERLAAIQGAAKRPELARKEGVDVKNPKAIQAKIAELKQEREAWENWSTSPDLIQQIRAMMAPDQRPPVVKPVEKAPVAEKPATPPTAVDRTPADRWAALSVTERQALLQSLGNPEAANVAKRAWRFIKTGDKAAIQAAWDAPVKVTAEVKPDEPEPPLLSSYTPAELKARQAAEEKAAADEKAQRKADHEKAAADRDAKDFRLAGSERPADVAAAQGQTNMLDAMDGKAPARPADYGANNTLVSRERAEELRKKLRAKFGQLNAGVDPEIVAMGTELAVFHIEAGVRQFVDFARVMVADLGVSLEAVRPFLRGWYNGARDMVEDHGLAVNDMDTPDQVKAALRLIEESNNGPQDSQRVQPGMGEVAARGGETSPRAEEQAGPPTRGGRAGNVAAKPPENVEAPAGEGVGAAAGRGAPGLLPKGDRGTGTGRNAADRREGGGNGGLADDGLGGVGGDGPGRGAGESVGGVAKDGAGITGADRNDGGTHNNAPVVTYPNYHIQDPQALIGGTPKARFAKNRQAIETFRELSETGLQPTPEQLDALAAYTGWGSFGQELFQGTWERPRPKAGWETESQWMRDTLGKDEWESAQSSILNAHYTDPPTVTAIWELVRNLGFTGGRVLEPAMGVGNFFGLMPRDLMAASQLTGIELDTLTAGIAKLLYPQASLRQMGYQDSKTADGFYDLVIGNWPFARQGPADRRYRALSPSLHDYFFLKAVDQVRPGGLVVGITSAFTLDKKGEGIRRELAKKAELVAAFRLPTGAFENYAGTAVVTDIIILKKRATPLAWAPDESWIRLGQTRGVSSDQEFSVNQYYLDHPDHVLGRLDYGTHTTFNRPGMIIERPEQYGERLARIASQVPVGVYEPVTTHQRTRYLTGETQDRQQSVTLSQNGQLAQVQGERLALLEDVRPYAVKDPAATAQREQQLRALIDLRRRAHTLFATERDATVGDAAVEVIRADLNQAYQQFVSQHGPINTSFGLKYLKKLGDPYSTDLAALETQQGEAWAPATALQRPTTRGKKKLGRLSVGDALVVARNERMDFDIKRVAELANTSPEQAAQTLMNSGALFRSPDGRYVVADQYLSGNARRALREARAAQEEGIEGMDRNIAALEKVVPKDIPYFHIEARLGAPWVPVDVYGDFAKDMLGVATEADRPSVRYVASGWKVDAHSMFGRPEGARFSTPDVSFRKVFEAALNVRTIQIRRTDADGNTTLDEQATREANQKVTDLREAFADWVWTAPERQVALERTYNEIMNATAMPSFDGSFLGFEGIALQRGKRPFDLRQHQINAIYRGLVNQRGLYAHEVGTGKTNTIAGIAVESRRYGLARKPLILAHNANSKSVAEGITKMYPNAKVLYINNLDRDTIESKLRQIKMDDWDAVVVPHSLIERFALTGDTLKELASEQIQALEEEAYAAAQEDGQSELLVMQALNGDETAMKKLRSPSAKDLVRARNHIVAKIENQAQRASREGSVPFEELGIDMIIVDEAHLFKKPPLETRMKMRGLAGGSSDRSLAMNFLTGYIKKLNGGKGVHLFTGTPITNTLTETFHMMRYVMDDEMRRDGLINWDAWFNTFASETNDIEITAAGEYEPVTRLASFINVADLRRMIGTYTDIVFADDMPEFKPRKTASGKTLADDLTDAERDELLNGRTEDAVGRPYKKVIVDSADMTPEQAEIMALLVDRARVFKNADRKTRREIMLSGGPESPLLVETAAANAGLDQRLFKETSYPASPTSKAARAVRNTLKHYHEHSLTTQVIFMERGFDAQGFNLAKAIVDDLVKGGIPRNQIAIVDGKTSADQRKAIVEAVKRADIRVVIGNTQTLGTGVNMQQNLRALHHLDAPWTPAELEQRNGRGHRQGNQWNTVLEYRYLTERIDGRRWQVLAVKDRFIKSFLKANENVRVIEGDSVDDSGQGDIVTTLSAAAGDPRILILNKLKADLEKLQARQRLHGRAVVEAKEQVEATQRVDDQARARKKAYEQYQKTVKAAEDSGKPLYVIDGASFMERGDAQTAMDDWIRRKLSPTEGVVVFGQVRGLSLWYQWSGSQVVPPNFYIGEKVNDRFALISMGKPTLYAADHAVWSLPRRIEEEETASAGREQTLANLERIVNEPFGRADELNRKKDQMAAVERDLQLNPVPPPAWLRNGAPVDSIAYHLGTPWVVTGHRWTPNDYRVELQTEDGKKLQSTPYDEITDSQGLPLYEPHPFVAPQVAQAGSAPTPTQRFAAASSPAAVTDALQALAGNALVQDLIDGGTLRVVAKQSQLPASIVIPAGQRVAGAVDPNTGVVYLIAENIAPDEIAGFLKHEVGVHQAQLGLNQPKSRALRLAHALTRLVGARQILGEPSFNDALAQLQRMRATSKPVQAAYAAAQQAMGHLNQNPALLHEEALAYLVQNHPKTSLAQQIIAAVRAFLYKAGLKINLTENDLQALAVAALRGRAGTKPASSAREVALQRAAQAQQDQGALVVRNPTQIKSAMGNTGAFSPDNADIRYAYVLGQAEPNLTAEEVLQRIEAGGEVTAEEFALLQAYLSGASRAVPASGVDAPSFKNWFGNSKIKGRNGQPLKMYHGTSADFTVFEAATSGTSTSHPTAALGFFFTNDRAHAATKYGDRVMEVYLAIEKPYVMTDADLRRIESREDALAFRRKLEAQGYDGLALPAETKTRYVVAFRPDQIKRTTNETYTRGEADVRFALANPRPFTPEQQAAMDKIGRREPQGWGMRFNGLRERIGLKLRQAIADHHAALLDLDRQAYGEGVVENQTAAASWVKARLSRSVDGPMHLLLHEAGLRMDADGALDVLPTVKGLQKVLAPLGIEVDDFMKWVAGNRAERLMQEGRENLFTPADIAALKTLNQGTMADGRNRATVYASVLKDFVALQKSVMDIAEQSGLIDGNERHVWEHDFYVPFYRLAEDTQDVRSINAGDGLVRQEAFKKLKGGKDRLNDLLENTVMNWQHLLSASLKNNAARQALTNAQRVRYGGIPVAEPINPAKESTKGAVYYRQNGQPQWFRVNDPLVLEAITALDFNGLKGPVMSLLRKARHLLTRTTTISPAFKVANLLRDTVQTLAVSQASAKTGGLGNIVQGWKNYAADSAIRQQMLAGSGAFLFGSTLEDHAEAMKKLLAKGVRPATILDTPAKLWEVLSLAYWKYEAFGDRLENANRAALYEQLRKQGKSHLYASFQARDLLDFSQSGASGAVRFLTAVVPFLNARIQGLDKLGRAASQSAQRGRFAVTLAAVTLASAALYLLYKDDDDFKQREEWDRDTYWWFKIGDTVFRIPKPFEVGALATLLGDRIMEQIFDREATPALYLDRLKQTLTQTFSVSMPQLFAPAVDVWRNRGSFTQRPIETLAQQRLSPELRQTASTSDVARGVSAASQGFLSPVQADYLIAGYFGWVGRQAVLMADHATRPLTDRPSPERLPVISDLMQRFVPTEQGGHSKYLTRFYEVAKTTEQHYADINELVKRGEIDAAKALVQRHREDLTRLKLYRKASTQLNDWNNQLKLLADLPASQISTDQRQRARETLQAAKLRLAQAVMAGQPAR